MFCPKCGDEYKDGIEKCAECGVQLVPQYENSQLDKKSGSEGGEMDSVDQNLTRIRLVGTVSERTFIKGYLESQNIYCEVMERMLGRAFPISNSYDLLIRAEDERKVREILDTLPNLPDGDTVISDESDQSKYIDANSKIGASVSETSIPTGITGFEMSDPVLLGEYETLAEAEKIKSFLIRNEILCEYQHVLSGIAVEDKFDLMVETDDYNLAREMLKDLEPELPYDD